MQIPGASARARWLNSLAERASKRGSAASRGEVSLLAGAGVVMWALLTLTVLVSDPQALPLTARDAQLSVGVAGSSTRSAPAVSSETPEPTATSQTAVIETATPAPTPPQTPSQTPSSSPASVVARSPSPTPTPRAAASTSVVAAGPPPVPPTSAPTPAPPTPTSIPAPIATQAPVAPPNATPAQTPPAVQVVGSGGVVLTGPRGGPLNTRGADLYNCNDFATLEQLLAVFLASGPSDPNHLDPLHTGSPCPPEDDEPQPAG